ncbi:MAG: hypothetical protein AB9873_18870 [Syntrophobacteraceae bacterium]
MDVCSARTFGQRETGRKETLVSLLRMLCIVGLLHLGPLCTPAASVDDVEVWESWYLCARATAEIKRTGSVIQGVLSVRQPFQDDWIYHFTGSVAGDTVEASHYSGHRFVGKLVSEREVSGVVTTRTGISFTITATRR